MCQKRIPLQGSLIVFVFKTAEDLGTALFIHPWDMQMGGRYSKYWLPWLVGK